MVEGDAPAWGHEDDFARVSELLRRYRGGRHVQVFLDIRAANPGFTDLTSLRLILPPFSGPSGFTLKLGSPRILGSPEISPSLLPALMSATLVSADSSAVVETRFRRSGHIEVDVKPDMHRSEVLESVEGRASIELELVMGGILRGVRLDQPDMTYGLALDLRVIGFDGPILMQLTHSLSMNLRRRIDNSEYQSLAYEMDNGRILKFVFFASPRAEIRYLLGAVRPSELGRLARPLLAASLGQIFMFVALGLMYRNRLDMATVPLAFGLLPAIALAAPLGTLRHGSRDIRVRSVSNSLVGLVGLAYGFVASIEVGTLLRTYPRYDQAALVALGAAVVFGVAGVVLLLALRYGLLPEYYCDSCGRRLWLRSRAALDVSSRKSICATCGGSGVLLSNGTTGTEVVDSEL